MKLSTNTLALLTNFSTINSNILFRPGNVIRTVSVSTELNVYAKIEEEIEYEFAIYDLPKLLKGIKLCDDPELEILPDESYLLIKDRNNTIKYFLTPPELVSAPENRNIKLRSQDVKFEIQDHQFERLLKIANAFSLADFTVLGKDGNITLQVRNKIEPTSNQGSILVGTTDKNFEFNFDKNNLLMIPGNYDVIISKDLVAQFINQDYELVYSVGLSSDSFFEN